jgi:hypothetical protein
LLADPTYRASRRGAAYCRQPFRLDQRQRHQLNEDGDRMTDPSEGPVVTTPIYRRVGYLNVPVLGHCPHHQPAKSVSEKKERSRHDSQPSNGRWNPSASIAAETSTEPWSKTIHLGHFGDAPRGEPPLMVRRNAHLEQAAKPECPGAARNGELGSSLLQKHHLPNSFQGDVKFDLDLILHFHGSSRDGHRSYPEGSLAQLS